MEEIIHFEGKPHVMTERTLVWIYPAKGERFQVTVSRIELIR